MWGKKGFKQECIKLIKSDIKTYIVTNVFLKMYRFHKKKSKHKLNIFNIDNNKCLFEQKNQYIRMISEWSCDTED